jgi:hypothetical protein
MAARNDFCSHERVVGSHETTYCPHRSNYRRTKRKTSARNDLWPHGNGNDPHETILGLWEAIFARTDFDFDS